MHMQTWHVESVLLSATDWARHTLITSTCRATLPELHRIEWNSCTYRLRCTPSCPLLNTCSCWSSYRCDGAAAAVAALCTAVIFLRSRRTQHVPGARILPPPAPAAAPWHLRTNCHAVSFHASLCICLTRRLNQQYGLPWRGWALCPGRLGATQPEQQPLQLSAYSSPRAHALRASLP